MDNYSLPTCQPAKDDDSVARWQGGKDDNLGFSKNSKQLRNFICNHCNTNWKNTKLSLALIQTQHVENNPGHAIVEVKS